MDNMEEKLEVIMKFMELGNYQNEADAIREFLMLMKMIDDVDVEEELQRLVKAVDINTGEVYDNIDVDDLRILSGQLSPYDIKVLQTSEFNSEIEDEEPEEEDYIKPTSSSYRTNIF